MAANNPKKKWKLINSVLNNKSNEESACIPSIRYEGKVQTIAEEIADSLNHHFANVGSNSFDESAGPSEEAISGNVYLGSGREVQNKILFPATESEVKKIISDLKIKSNETVSKLSNKILKHCVDNLVKTITQIVNLSFHSGIVPDVYKIAKVVPVFKKGDIEDPVSYTHLTLPTKRIV